MTRFSAPTTWKEREGSIGDGFNDLEMMAKIFPKAVKVITFWSWPTASLLESCRPGRRSNALTWLKRQKGKRQSWRAQQKVGKNRRQFQEESGNILGCPWKLVTIVSKLVYNLLMGLITYLYRGYNPVTRYHGHPSSPIRSPKILKIWKEFSDFSFVKHGGSTRWLRVCSREGGKGPLAFASSPPGRSTGTCLVGDPAIPINLFQPILKKGVFTWQESLKSEPKRPGFFMNVQQDTKNKKSWLPTSIANQRFQSFL